MNTYERGTAITVLQRFWLIDPVTEAGTPTDPTTVTFEMVSPSGEIQTFTFGVDDAITNPQTGLYIASLSPQLPVGIWTYRWTGTGTVESATEGTFEVLESGVLTPAPPTTAVTGPCQGWINGDDVAACGPDLGVGSDTYLLDDVAWQASSLLYDLSGRQFPGVCERTVRPCLGSCGCWNNLLSPASPGIAGAWSWGGGWAGGFGVGPVWVNDYAGLQCGCGGTSEVRLAGYPVRKILEVKIDGVALPEFDADTGARNWRLDERDMLVRMWAPNGTNPTQQWWPSCQVIALDDDQPGTFSIRYQWGADAPFAGKKAAEQLARELWKACNGTTCALPTKVTKVVRQGITIERVVPIAKMLRQGSTGMQLVDAFIAQYNPNGMIRRPMIYTPDDQQYAKKVGQ